MSVYYCTGRGEERTRRTSMKERTSKERLLTFPRLQNGLFSRTFFDLRKERNPGKSDSRQLILDSQCAILESLIQTIA